MKKVIVFSAELLPYSETFIREQVRAMRHWHPVLVGEHLTPKGLSLDGLDVQLLYPTEHRRMHRRGFRLCRLLRLPYPPTLRKLRQIDAQLIHVHFGTNAADIWPQVRALGLPMLITLHGYDINIHREWWESGNGGQRRRRYPRDLLRLAHEPKVHFIAVSETIRKRAIEYGIPADKIIVRYIGVDTNAFQPGLVPIAKRRKRILFVGRLVEKKGTEILIRAFARVHDEIPDAELMIAGDGPLATSLQALAHSLNISVEFLGAISNDEVQQQMHQARIFCLPSITATNGDAEGLPIAILEAQASGIPVVTSARGGVGEAVLHNETGMVFEEGMIATLTSHLILLLRDTNLATTLSTEARMRVAAQFALPLCSKSLEATYEDVASKLSGITSNS